jgi:PhnB protein
MTLLRHPAGEHTLTPHLVVPSADAASTWYQRAFGAEERSRLPLPGGQVMYVELAFGDTTIMVADEFPAFGVLSPLSIGGTATVFHLLTDAVDTLWQRAVEAGAREHHPLEDQFWGDRSGQLLDPFGHRWGLTQHLRSVSREELEREAAKFFAPA